MTDITAVFARAEEVYHTKSLPKYPTWEGLSDDDQFDAIMGELGEWGSAFLTKDTHGEHGEVNELLDVIVTAARRIMAIEE